LSQFCIDFRQRCIVHILITIVMVTVLDGGTRLLSPINSNRFHQLISEHTRAYAALSGVVGAAISLTISRACMLAAASASVSFIACLKPLP
jgi:hypothetical protein